LRDYPSGDEDFSNIKDVQKDPILVWQHKHYLALVLLTNIGVPAFLGFIHGDVIAGLLLGGLLRLVLSQHVTYLINSIAHMWGKQTYSDKSSARDNPLLALITYGEGYHNYHHTFQWDYRNGIHWWHYDPTKWVIRILSFVGLTRDLKRCAPAQIEKARIEQQYRSLTERCELMNVPEKWRLRVEQEYQQLLHTLQQWSDHRHAWYETRGRKLQEKIGHWDRIQLRDRYREVQFQLKLKKRRWQQLVRNLASPLPATA